MREIEKLKAGLEYCYDDEEVDALKQNAIKNCRIYNSIDDEDRQKQYDFCVKCSGLLVKTFGLAKHSAVITEKTYSSETTSLETSI